MEQQDKAQALAHYSQQAAQATFEAKPRMSWERYATSSYADGCATMVTSEQARVRLSWIEHRANLGITMTPDHARALAAELIAAADAAEVTQ